MSYDAILIAGGRGVRLGGSKPGDKATVEVGGRTLLDRMLDVTAGAAETIVVGPETPTARPVRWVQEHPPGSGPPAALAAGLGLTTSPLVLVLAVDMPAFAPAIEALLAALDAAPNADVAAMRSDDGRPQPLGCLWRTGSLRPALERRAEGASLRSMFDTVDCIVIDDPEHWSADIDTPADLDRYRPPES